MAIRVPGVRLGVAQAGIKKSAKDDLILIELAPGIRGGRGFYSKCLLRRTRAAGTRTSGQDSGENLLLADQHG